MNFSQRSDKYNSNNRENEEKEIQNDGQEDDAKQVQKQRLKYELQHILNRFKAYSSNTDNANQKQ